MTSSTHSWLLLCVALQLPTVWFVLPAKSASFVLCSLDLAFCPQAHWAISQGVRAGDVVALMMINRPEFVVTYLAMAKIGAVTAFLNHNLRGAIAMFPRCTNPMITISDVFPLSVLHVALPWAVML